MYIPSDDEIAKFFDELTPESFLSVTETSADIVEQELYPRHGKEEFELFTFRHLSELAGTRNPFASLHNGTSFRNYVPGDDEDLGAFLLRIAKEVTSFGAKWFFIGAPGEASMGHLFDPNDPRDVQTARTRGDMFEVTNWYSESIELTSSEVRFGIIYDEDDQVKVIESTFAKGANPAFRRVLHYEK